MPDMTIDDVHRLLDVLEQGMEELEDLEGPDIDVKDVSEICAVAIELNGWAQSAYNDLTFGLEPSVLNKFLKMQGRASKHTAKVVADRLRSYLRGQDQAHPEDDLADEAEDFADEEEMDDREVAAPVSDKVQQVAVSVSAERWVVVPAGGEMRRKIELVASLLDSIVAQVGRSNSPPNEQALSPLEKAQLIAVLETTLAILRAPLVEKGMLKKASDALGRAAGKAAEKGMQEGMGAMATAAREKLVELLALLF